MGRRWDYWYLYTSGCDFDETALQGSGREMNGGPYAPTVADYAQSAADDANTAIKRLMKVIADLERRVAALEMRNRPLR